MHVSVPNGDCFWGDDEVAGVLNYLGGRVKQEELGDIWVVGGDHGDGIDNGGGVEKCLDDNFPDMGNVAIFDVDGAEEERDAEGEDVELDDDEGGEEDGPVEIDAVDDGEKQDDTEVDTERNEGGDGSGDDEDVFGEVDFTEEVATRNDRLDTEAGGFGEESPENGTGEEVDGVVRDVATPAEKINENDVDDGEKHERFDDGPEIAESGALVFELEVGFDEFF